MPIVNKVGSGSTTATSYPTVKEGSTGSAVKQLQQLLTDLGYDTGGVDGSFGPHTAAEVKDFQRANGLVADGVVGPKTWGMLQGLGTPQTPAPTPPVSGSGDVFTPTPPAGGAAAGRYGMGVGAQASQVLSTYTGSGRYGNAPAGSPLVGMHGYSQLTIGGQTAAQFTAKADYDSDGSATYTDSGTHSDDTSMHFRVNGKLKAVDGESVPYVVLPPEIVAKTGAKLGDLVQVTFHGKSTFAIYADGGPKGKAGELSGAAARAVGITDDGNRKAISGNDGRDTQDVVYTVLAQSGASVGITDGGAPVTAADVQARGAQAFFAAQQSGLLSR
jgi:peptidoglycan hydrolase-like protein with peptidoglycan-binding domain